MNAIAIAEGKQLDLIRRTVAKDCDPAEFDQFIHICKAVRLDPLRRQIYAFVFSKNNPQFRRMSIVTGIDGYRAIAERTGNYRPDDLPPRIEYDPALRGPKNPLGIIRAEVTVYKFSHGNWHRVVAEAYWDEYAPIKGEALDDKKDNWRKMARVMISKCAEAQALRKAWPDDFAGLDVEEETDRFASIELTASELADEAATAQRFEAIGGANALTVDWCSGEPLERVPVGQFADRILAYLRDNEPMTISVFQERNKETLKEYWAKDKSGALELKKAFEAAYSREAAE